MRITSTETVKILSKPACSSYLIFIYPSSLSWLLSHMFSPGSPSSCPLGVLRVGPVQAQGQACHTPALPSQEGAAAFVRHHREEQSPQYGVRCTTRLPVTEEPITVLLTSHQTVECSNERLQLFLKRHPPPFLRCPAQGHVGPGCQI